MSLNLTVDYVLSNGKKLVFGRFDFDDDNEVLTYPLELRTTSAAGDSLVCRTTQVVRNGTSTSLVRQLTPPVGLNIEDIQRYFVVGTRTTPTGYTDAKTAERAAGNSKSARRTALEAHMLSAGHVDPVSLAAT